MEIKRIGSQPSVKGPSDWFTGDVRIDQPFQGTDAARVGGAIVTLGKWPFGGCRSIHLSYGRAG